MPSTELNKLNRLQSAEVWQKQLLVKELILAILINGFMPILILTTLSFILSNPELRATAFESSGPGASLGGFSSCAIHLFLGRRGLLESPPPLLRGLLFIALPVAAFGLLVGLLVEASGVSMTGGATSMATSAMIGASVTCLVWKLQLTKFIKTSNALT